MTKSIRNLILILVSSMIIFSGCSSNNNQDGEIVSNNGTNKEQQQETKTDINIAVLKGPTGIGSVKLMNDSESGSTKNNYNFQIASSPDEVNGKIISGELDIAAVPTNVASVLYNKTEGNVKIAALNTLGVLYILENGNTINTIEDLKGKTIYSSGQGATPEYALNYILEKNNIDDVTIEYMSEHAELATALASGSVEIGLLPEPNVTAVTMKNENTRIAINLTDEWNKVGEGSQLTMGCIVARKEFVEQNKEAFDNFLDEYKSSIEYTSSNLDSTASLVAKYEIMASSSAAKNAIPNCNIVYIDGEEMKTAAKGFYEVLFNANPQSIGGKLPDENFYYSK